jgi:hypothetical protein
MKNRNLVLVAMLFLCYASGFSQTKDLNFLDTDEAYLGQKKPGNIPVVFAPTIVSNGDDANTCSFSSDGKQIVFTKWGDKPVLMYALFSNNAWSKPKEIKLTNMYEMEGIFTPIGNQLIFAAGTMSGKWSPDDLWTIEITEKGNSNLKKFDILKLCHRIKLFTFNDLTHLYSILLWLMENIQIQLI